MPPVARTYTDLLARMPIATLDGVSAQDIQDFLHSAMRDHRDAHLRMRGVGFDDPAADIVPSIIAGAALALMQGASGPALQLLSRDSNLSDPGSDVMSVFHRSSNQIYGVISGLGTRGQIWTRGWAELGLFGDVPAAPSIVDTRSDVPGPTITIKPSGLEGAFMLGCYLLANDPEVLIGALAAAEVRNSHLRVFAINRNGAPQIDNIGVGYRARSPNGNLWELTPGDDGVWDSTLAEGGAPQDVLDVMTALGADDTTCLCYKDARFNVNAPGGELAVDGWVDARAMVGFDPPFTPAPGAGVDPITVAGGLVSTPGTDKLVTSAAQEPPSVPSPGYQMGTGAGQIKTWIIVGTHDAVAASGEYHYWSSANRWYVRAAEFRCGPGDEVQIAVPAHQVAGARGMMLIGMNAAGDQYRFEAHGRAVQTGAFAWPAETDQGRIGAGWVPNFGNFGAVDAAVIIGLTYVPTTQQIADAFAELQTQHGAVAFT